MQLSALLFETLKPKVEKSDLAALLKGEDVGHPFRGNQYISGESGGLYHYTTPESAEGISKDGFRLANNSMYIHGVYFTDKPDQNYGNSKSTRLSVGLADHKQLEVDSDTDIPRVVKEITGIDHFNPRAREALISAGYGSVKFPVDNEKYTVVLDPKLISVNVQKNLDNAAHQAATSPLNLKPAPTERQAKAGNYKKGHYVINGMRISIENPAGSKRRPEWPTLTAHYGYVKGTLGNDGDAVDIFLRPSTPSDWNGKVYVIEQLDAQGNFDEDKVMFGWDSMEEARKAYLSNYKPGWTGCGEIKEFTQEEFKQAMKKGDLPGHEFRGNQYTDRNFDLGDKEKWFNQSGDRVLASGSVIYSPLLDRPNGAITPQMALKPGNLYMLDNAPIKNVSVDSLVGAQTMVEGDRLKPWSDDAPPITAVQWEGKTWVVDGNHRAASAWAAGKSEIRAKFTNLDDPKNSGYLKPIKKGDLPGHEFRGNQYTEGTSLGGAKNAKEFNQQVDALYEEQGVTDWQADYLGSLGLKGYFGTSQAFQLNNTLRNGGKLSSREKEAIDKVRQGFKDSSVELPKETTLYRAVSGDFADKVLSLNPGESVTDKAFSSTAGTKSATKDFGNVRMEITPASGMRGLIYRDETEVLLPEGVKYTVTGSKSEGKTKVVYVTAEMMGKVSLSNLSKEWTQSTSATSGITAYGISRKLKPKKKASSITKLLKGDRIQCWSVEYRSGKDLYAMHLIGSELEVETHVKNLKLNRAEVLIHAEPFEFKLIKRF